MNVAPSLHVATFLALLFGTAVGACTAEVGPEGGVGGGVASGGVVGGGASSGGANTGGTTTGGANTGGTTTGGANTGGLSSGGGSPAGGTTAYPATFATIETIVATSFDVAQGCGSVSCHHGEATPHFTNDENLYEVLLDASNATEMEYCGAIPFITPGDPSKSAFFKAISEGCEGLPGFRRMPAECDPDPQYGNCLPQGAIDAVEAWILAGAPKE